MPQLDLPRRPSKFDRDAFHVWYPRLTGYHYFVVDTMRLRNCTGIATWVNNWKSPVAEPKDAAPELLELQIILGLSSVEMAGLFHISEAELAQWRRDGVPSLRKATAGRLLDLARLLRDQIIPERIPEIVRTREEWLGNRSILEVLGDEGVDPIYVYLDRLFLSGA